MLLIILICIDDVFVVVVDIIINIKVEIFYGKCRISKVKIKLRFVCRLIFFFSYFVFMFEEVVCL